MALPERVRYVASNAGAAVPSQEGVVVSHKFRQQFEFKLKRSNTSVGAGAFCKERPGFCQTVQTRV